MLIKLTILYGNVELLRSARMRHELAEARGEAPGASAYRSSVDTGEVRARWERMNFNNRFQAALEASVEDGEREGWPASVPFVDYRLVDRAREELGEDAAYAMECAISADPC